MPLGGGSRSRSAVCGAGVCGVTTHADADGRSTSPLPHRLPHQTPSLRSGARSGPGAQDLPPRLDQVEEGCPRRLEDDRPTLMGHTRRPCGGCSDCPGSRRRGPLCPRATRRPAPGMPPNGPWCNRGTGLPVAGTRVPKIYLCPRVGEPRRHRVVPPHYAQADVPTCRADAHSVVMQRGEVSKHPWWTVSDVAVRSAPLAAGTIVVEQCAQLPPAGDDPHPVWCAFAHSRLAHAEVTGFPSIDHSAGIHSPLRVMPSSARVPTLHVPRRRFP
jgi:hypothetical protein